MYRIIQTDQLRSAKNNGGFTIIEVMIALGILSIGILSVAAMQLHAAKGNRSAGLRTEAVTRASEKMEELSSKGHDHADLAAGTYAENDGQFDLSWTISNNSPIAGTKTIELTVEWNSGRDSANFSSIIADLD